MRDPRKWGAAILIAVLVMVTQLAFAQDVTENVGKTKVNWTKKEMVFTGDGAVNLNAPNAASARLGAERAAKLSALRNALEAIKGIKIKAGETVGQKMQAKDSIRTSVEGVIKGFIEGEVRYYSDGGVQRDLIIPLDGVLSKAILGDEVKAAPAPVKKAEEPKKVEEPAKAVAAAPAPEPAKKEEPKKEEPKKAEPAKKTTGLVVIAKGFKVIPVLAPKIIDEDGKDVYDVTMVSDADLDNGIASYIKDGDLAKADKKVASTPLVVKALKSPNAVDLVVSNADAEKIRTMAKNSPMLAEGRVIVVKD